MTEQPQPNQPRKEEQGNFITNYFKNLKNMKKNFTAVANNPYKFQKFQGILYKWIIGAIIVVMIWQFIVIFRSYSAGSGGNMAIITKAVLVIVMVIIISKVYGMYRAQQQIVAHYEANPVPTIDNYANEKKLDVKAEVDSILSKYDEKGKLKV